MLWWCGVVKHGVNDLSAVYYVQSADIPSCILNFAAKYLAHSHPKTFQLRTIAALPEPAGRPTHGLLSRRSTDRISTSLLANFAQLSMFRFDGLTIAKAII